METVLYNVCNVMKNIPSKASNPQRAQTIKLRPTDCVSSKTPLGETKIPEPNGKKIFDTVAKILHIVIYQ